MGAYCHSVNSSHIFATYIWTKFNLLFLLWEFFRQETSASFVHYLLSWSIFVCCQQFCFSCLFASLWISMQQTFTFEALDYTKVYVLLGDSKACLSRKNSTISCFLFFRHFVFVRPLEAWALQISADLILVMPSSKDLSWDKEWGKWMRSNQTQNM
jgi:hypothetical protein